MEQTQFFRNNFYAILNFIPSFIPTVVGYCFSTASIQIIFYVPKPIFLENARSKYSSFSFFPEKKNLEHTAVQNNGKPDFNSFLTKIFKFWLFFHKNRKMSILVYIR